MSAAGGVGLGPIVGMPPRVAVGRGDGATVRTGVGVILGVGVAVGLGPAVGIPSAVAVGLGVGVGALADGAGDTAAVVGAADGLAPAFGVAVVCGDTVAV